MLPVGRSSGNEGQREDPGFVLDLEGVECSREVGQVGLYFEVFNGKILNDLLDYFGWSDPF